MTQFHKSSCVPALFIFAAAVPAAASPVTFTPGAAGLNGGTFTADTLVLSDNAQVTFGNGGTTFVDTGYLPVIGFRLNGQDVAAPGYLPSGGGGWGAYISYSGSGTVVLSPAGIPASATFQQLAYSIVSYNGVATFGFGADGSAITGGAVRDVKTWDTGSLISGQLAFTFLPGEAAPTIVGQVQASLTAMQDGLIQGQPSGVDVTFIHPSAEYAFTSQTTLQIAGGNLSTAVLTVPEPASAALLGVGLAAAAALRGRRRAARPPQARDGTGSLDQ